MGALCQVHLLLYLREVWAERLQVEVEDVQGPVFADMARFDNVGSTSLPPGATLVAVDESSPAFSAKPKQAVLIITKAQEAQGRRYRGDEELRDGKGKVSMPQMGPMYFEVRDQPYAVRVWCDAQTATSRMRKLAIAANRQAKKAGSELPFGDIFTAKGFRDLLGSRSMRRSMATACVIAHVPEAVWMPIGRWKKRATAMKYVEDADAFAALAVNVSDVVVHGKCLEAASDSTVLLEQLSTKDAENLRLVEENTRMRVLLELHGLPIDAQLSMGAASQALRGVPPERLQLALSGARGGGCSGDGGAAGPSDGATKAAEQRGGGGRAAEGRGGGAEAAEGRVGGAAEVAERRGGGGEAAGPRDGAAEAAERRSGGGGVGLRDGAAEAAEGREGGGAAGPCDDAFAQLLALADAVAVYPHPEVSDAAAEPLRSGGGGVGLRDGAAKAAEGRGGGSRAAVLRVDTRASAVAILSRCLFLRVDTRAGPRHKHKYKLLTRVTAFQIPRLRIGRDTL